ncbi:MAG: hypothetical protein KDA81_12170, partial [Planctomycetaceae bacterium]|nr:hypothetical protein [Planctomycetaceae bacterium]
MLSEPFEMPPLSDADLSPRVIDRVPASLEFILRAMSPQIDDTFAEAFPMVGTRFIITAVDLELATVAA